ncbi:MAG: 4Fe-4S dicluster domain-containing protein [Candidatus Marinimicrobia bacterium]|nr:4Fe-4S dicluster domain-containing protein [Candidatus Neomarinimicrobiota bacterium]
MAKIKGHISINIDNCKGCELCIVECPQDSLKMSEHINTQGYHYAVLVQDNCTGCTNCALVCPEAIITVYRESKNKTKKERVAVITNVTENITVNVS